MTQAPTMDDLKDSGADEAQQSETQEGSVEVRDAELGEVEDNEVSGQGAQIDVLLDTNVTVTATLGSTQMPVRDILELTTGSVVRLDRFAGDPVDLHLNGIRFARGHLVVVGDQLAVQINDVIQPEPPEEVFEEAE